MEGPRKAYRRTKKKPKFVLESDSSSESEVEEDVPRTRRVPVSTGVQFPFASTSTLQVRYLIRYLYFKHVSSYIPLCIL